MKSLRNKPQVKNMNISYDLYYTVIENREGKEEENEDNNNDFLYDDISIPNYSRRYDVIFS